MVGWFVVVEKELEVEQGDERCLMSVTTINSKDSRFELGRASERPNADRTHNESSG
jgi:hypothetical protein